MSDKDGKIRSGKATNQDAIRLEVPYGEIAGFCVRNHILKLSFFGSVLRDDFQPGSDVDVLVEFEPGHVPGLFAIVGMEIELSEHLGGRKVDMNTPSMLSKYYRDEVLDEAEVIYDPARHGHHPAPDAGPRT